MSTIDISRIRSIALVGHGGAGKTSIGDAIAHTTGLNTRLGSVPEGTSVLDFEPEEQARRGSVQVSLVTCNYDGFRIHVLDTPGDGNFLSDSLVCLQAADSAVIVISAVDGVEASTERMSTAAARLGLARMLFINKLDNDRSDWRGVIEEAKEVLGVSPVLLQLPIGEHGDFKGVVDLVNQRALLYSGDGGTPTVAEVPEDMVDEVAEALEAMVEAVAETDDELIEKYLDEGELTQEEVRSGLNQGILNGMLTPVVLGSAIKNIGVDQLLWACRALPSPAQRKPVTAVSVETGDELELSADPSAPLATLCFKTIIDPFAGQISLLRVFQGTVSSDSHPHNSRTDKGERFGQLFHLCGKKQTPVKEALPGDIFGVAKLRDTATGDSLSDSKHVVTVQAEQAPPPMTSLVLRPTSRGAEDKIKSVMAKLLAEDPGLHQGYDPVTKEIVLSGMGQNHIQVTVQKMKRKFGIEVELAVPTIPYRETISTSADVRYRHKKQSGGAGQFGEVAIKVEPNTRGAGFEFIKKIVGGVIPGSLVPSVEKGVRRQLALGILAGFPVVDVKVTLYDGKTHPVDSKDIAFQIAGRQAVKKGVLQARPVLLEPIYEMEIVVPEESVGDIMGDMNSRRGRILNMESRGRNSAVKVLVPLAEVQSYAPDLNSMTGGKGVYTMKLHQYDPVPSHMQAKLVAEINRVQEDED
jgi:elongation factor G